MSNAAKLYLTEEDYEVLVEAVDDAAGFQQELLEDELARAEVVSSDEIPDNVVTLHSRARVVDESTSEEREITVVPPEESAGTLDGRVSVLAPLGAAVIGLSEGQVIDWPMPSGRSRRFRVTQVLYQPEAARKEMRGWLPAARNRGSSKGSPGKGSPGHLYAVESPDRVEQASMESFPASDPPGWRL